MTLIKDRFRMQVVVDPLTNAPVAGATFTVYDAADSGLTTPLTVLDMTDVPMTLASGPLGIIPDFQVPGHTQIIAISMGAGLATPLDSMLSFLLSVLPDPTLIADGYTLTTVGGAYALQTPVGGDIRHDVTITTGTLAVYGQETGTVPMRPSYALVAVETDRASRLRLYANPTKAAADVARPRGVAPDITSNFGMVCDITFPGPYAAADPWICSPSVFGVVVPYGNDVAYTIDNLDASGPAAVQMKLTYMRIEQ